MDGPAYARPPRDTQRSAVDKTFLEMLGQAQQLKGSVFDDPKSAAMRDAYELAEAGPQAGILVPKAGLGKAFTPAEMEAQRLWGKYAPKMLEAFKNDKRPNGEYVLDLLNDMEKRGETTGFYDEITRRLKGPIQIAINPKKWGFETLFHEPIHAFSMRRNPVYGQGGNPPVSAAFKKLDPDVKSIYRKLGEGDWGHAETYFRADEAAKRTGLAPGSYTSIKEALRGQ